MDNLLVVGKVGRMFAGDASPRHESSVLSVQRLSPDFRTGRHAPTSDEYSDDDLVEVSTIRFLLGRGKRLGTVLWLV